MSKKETLPTAAAGNALKKEFKGYTMEELRYQKALAALRKEFCKTNMLHAIDNLKKPSASKAIKAIPLVGQAAKMLPIGKEMTKSSTGSSAMAIGKSAFKFAIGRLKPLDYVFLAFSLVGPAIKVVKLFRKKK